MNLTLLESNKWKDYELLDSGNGQKLERFGAYRFVRPEAQAIWEKASPDTAWRDVHGVFQPTSEESGGHWALRKQVDEKWSMSYDGIKFWAMTTPGRHLGVFPEVAAHWDWYSDLIEKAGRPIKVLNLFGYTGLASLMAAKAGAQGDAFVEVQRCFHEGRLEPCQARPTVLFFQMGQKKGEFIAA